MRKLILSMHMSFDGFVGGPKGELDWIHVDEQLFDYIVKLTAQSDTAMYGRVTYQMMENYWPAAGTQANASRHDIEHSRWYNSVTKVVVSNTMQSNPGANIKIIGKNIAEQVNDLKTQSGKNILIFGSPSAARSLIQLNLIDDYWMFINPIILGSGIPLFKNINTTINLKLGESKVFDSGVVEMHYIRKL